MKAKTRPTRVYVASFGALSTLLLGFVLVQSPKNALTIAERSHGETYSSSRLAELNYVINGGFENGLSNWEIFANNAGDIQISSTNVRSGANSALMTSPLDRSIWVQQVVNVQEDSAAISLSFYPAGGTYRGWFTWVGFDQDGQGRHQMTLIFQDGSLVIEHKDTRNDGTITTAGDSIPNVVASSSWNELYIEARPDGRPQRIFLNDNLVSTLTVPFSLSPVDHVGAGFPGSITYYGTIYFDDVSIVSEGELLAVDDECIVRVGENRNGIDGCGVPTVRNDLDADGDSLWVTTVTQGNYGESMVGATGSGVVYDVGDTVPLDYSDGFMYTVTDGVHEASATVNVLYECGCSLTYTDCNEELDSGARKAETEIDPDLLRRFRDEWLLTTADGTRYTDYYYNLTEVLRIFILDRPDLRTRFVSLAEMLQPSIRDVLDGDGTSPIAQQQTDSVEAFLGDLSAVGSDSLKRLIADQMDRIGPLGDYVGMPVGDVLLGILGDPRGTGASDELPSEIRLLETYPNPFGSTVEIRFKLVQPARVTVDIFDIRGRKLKTLDDAYRSPGMHSIRWDASGVGSGVYFVRMEEGDRVVTRSMTLAR